MIAPVVIIYGIESLGRVGSVAVIADVALAVPHHITTKISGFEFFRCAPNRRFKLRDAREQKRAQVTAHAVMSQ
jgi:hypothetical protein